MALYLGLDLGTQGFKAVVYDAKSRQLVSRGSKPYNIIESKVPGRAEQAPATWLEAGVQAVKQALSSVDRSAIRGIGISGQQHGLLALDKDGKVLRNAKLWCDTESAAEAKELSQLLDFTLGQATHDLQDLMTCMTYIAICKVPSFTVTKLLWMKRNEPQLYEQLSWVLLPKDYFNWFLTGRYVMEYGDASGTGIFDIINKTWDKPAIQAVDPNLGNCLPELAGPNEVIGTVLPEVAELLGLPQGIIVSPGSGDNACSALGAGIFRDGQFVVSLGTSGTIFGKSEAPILDKTGLICPFCDATGAYLPLICTLNCTRALEEVCEGFGLDHHTLTQLAAQEPAGCGGVNCLPFLVGERTPNWPHATGVLSGLRPGSLRPGLLYRAAMEGATFSLLSGLHRMIALGVHPTEIRLVGGGSKNPLWRQMVADSFQLPIRLPLEAESAALGAALQAAACHAGIPVADYIQENQPPLADEVIVPDPSKADAYEEALGRHQALGEMLFASTATLS